MAYARGDNVRDRHASGSTSHNTSRMMQGHSIYRSNSIDPTETTLSVVDDFKRVIRDRKQDSQPISQSEIESEVAEIRRSAHLIELDANQLKGKLRSNLRNCSTTIVQQSMAYGSNVDEIEPIVEWKMDNTNDDEDQLPTDTSIENLVEPLKRLKRELDRIKTPALFKDVRKFGADQTDRATRLLLSEANHIIRSLKDFAYEDAEVVVKAIQESDCEKDDEDTILAVIKTCRGYDDVRTYLDRSSKTKATRNRSKTPEDRYGTPTLPRKSAANPRTPDDDDDNDTSSFKAQPVQNPNARQSANDVPRRVNPLTDDRLSRSPPRERPRRN